MDRRQASATARWTMGILCLLIAIGVVGWSSFPLILFLAYFASGVGFGQTVLLAALFVGVPLLFFLGIAYVIVEWRVRRADEKRRRADHSTVEA